jgi:type II secretory pathway component PulL
MLLAQCSALRKSVMAFLLCLAVVSITSCARHQSDRNEDAQAKAACYIYQPIYLFDADISSLSDAAAKQIAAHNSIWETLCGEGSL